MSSSTRTIPSFSSPPLGPASCFKCVQVYLTAAIVLLQQASQFIHLSFLPIHHISCWKKQRRAVSGDDKGRDSHLLYSAGQPLQKGKATPATGHSLGGQSTCVPRMMQVGNVNLLLKHHLEPSSPLWVDDTGALKWPGKQFRWASVALLLGCLGRTEAESEL